MGHVSKFGRIAIATAALVGTVGCSSHVDPYGNLAWVDMRAATPSAAAPANAWSAAALQPMMLGAGDALGSVTYESYLAWIAAPTESATMAEAPTDD